MTTPTAHLPPTAHLHPKLDAGSFERFRVLATNGFANVAASAGDAAEAIARYAKVLRSLRPPSRGARRHIRRQKAGAR